MLGDPDHRTNHRHGGELFPVEPRRVLRAVGGQDSRQRAGARQRGGAEHTLIDFIGEVKDEFGTTVSNVRDNVDIKLTGETAAELAKHPINYDTGFTLLPGKYTIKFLARDDETGPHRHLS